MTTAARVLRTGFGRPADLPLTRWERRYARLVRGALFVCFAITVALFVGLAGAYSKSTPLAWIRIALGAVLSAEAAVLAGNLRGGRDLVVNHARAQGNRMVRTRAGGSVVSLALQLLGVVWIAAGLFLLVRGLEHVF